MINIVQLYINHYHSLHYHHQAHHKMTILIKTTEEWLILEMFYPIRQWWAKNGSRDLAYDEATGKPSDLVFVKDRVGHLGGENKSHLK